jgi:hypothetical protein
MRLKKSAENIKVNGLHMKMPKNTGIGQKNFHTMAFRILVKGVSLGLSVRNALA